MGEAAQQMLAVDVTRAILSQPAPLSWQSEDWPGELAGEEPSSFLPLSAGYQDRSPSHCSWGSGSQKVGATETLKGNRGLPPFKGEKTGPERMRYTRSMEG